MRSAMEIIQKKGLKPIDVASQAGVSITTLYKIPSKYDILDRIASVIGEPIEVVFDIDRQSPYPKQ